MSQTNLLISRLLAQRWSPTLLAKARSSVNCASTFTAAAPLMRQNDPFTLLWQTAQCLEQLNFCECRSASGNVRTMKIDPCTTQTSPELQIRIRGLHEVERS